MKKPITVVAEFGPNGIVPKSVKIETITYTVARVMESGTATLPRNVRLFRVRLFRKGMSGLMPAALTISFSAANASWSLHS